MTNPESRIGLGRAYEPDDRDTRVIKDYVNLKLAARGFQIVGEEEDFPFLEMGRSLLANFQEKMRFLQDHLSPVDQRIQTYLQKCLNDVPRSVIDTASPMIPANALILEKHGIARLLSLPPDCDSFRSDIVSSFRVAQGVCHNPAKDRRTTEGVFHVCEGGLPIPADKRAVPKTTFAHLLRHAVNPPRELLTIPYTSTQEQPSHSFISLLLRPIISPAVEGLAAERSMEIRFFAPGNLVSNLDFVESIFGNAGDPHLQENNAALDVESWSGHTGCVILAPHLVTLTKKDVGLPHISEATDRQKSDGMCWESEDELYNDGSAFKVTCRDRDGIIVTLIADNYFGYCKKEVKTQISYATNLLGGCEEEHSGGAIAFPSFDHGENFSLSRKEPHLDHRFAEAMQILGDAVTVHPEGYGTDRGRPDIIYVPENAEIDLHLQKITWDQEGTLRQLPLRPQTTYVYPSGYKVEMSRPSVGQRWRLLGTQAEGTFCHKPCTVSGGGKSEISKSLNDAMTSGPVIIPEFHSTMQKAREVLERNYWDRYPHPRKTAETSRPVLDPRRSLGSVLRLLTTNPEYTDEHNDFVKSLPTHVVEMVLIIKRFYKEDWGSSWDDWSGRFSVDVIDGAPGYELKYRNQHLVTRYLRVGYVQDGSWRTFRLRKDFLPAVKLQREDDITASTVLKTTHADGLHPRLPEGSYKFVSNCEFRFFQRPDEAIHRGYDKTTETDFANGGNFFSNYEPISRDEAKRMMDDTIRFSQFTLPMQKRLRRFVEADHPDYVVSSAHPRQVEGKPSKNPRYLQDRPDLHNHRGEYLARVGMRLYRRQTAQQSPLTPVNAVLPGRRNNPPEPEKGIRSLAVYGPIHYQELPELFMDFISSLTGKSPSTTGAGSEGALTKGPFNALQPVIDLNNALVSSILTKEPTFTSAAGYIGPRFRVDHDISLIIPEIWSRMHIAERDPKWLIEQEMLERCEDFTYQDQTILGSRLGYRITEKFVDRFFGRVFSDPTRVFTNEMLRPEEQGEDAYADGINNIVETQQKVARLYFIDGSIDFACPPLKALLHIMAHGHFEGNDVHAAEVRRLFDYEYVMNSHWYRDRLRAKSSIDIRLARRQVEHLEAFLANDVYRKEARRLDAQARLEGARERLREVENPAYIDHLHGTLGADPAVV